jgi:hypothetical protein
MIRWISYFALFTACNSFASFQWLNKIINYSIPAANLSKNIIPVVSGEKKIKKPLEPGWYDGEIPWDIEDDNYTTARISLPTKPITPLKFEEQNAFKYRIICAVIE